MFFIFMIIIFMIFVLNLVNNMYFSFFLDKSGVLFFVIGILFFIGVILEILFMWFV